MSKYRIVEKINMEFNFRSGSNYVEVTKYYIEERHWFLGWCKLCYFYTEKEAREKIHELEYTTKESIISI